MSETGPIPRPDPALNHALRDAEGEPPFAEVDWERLRGRIAAGAELPLARLRREAAEAPASAPALAATAGPSSARARRWRVPLAAAAGIAAVALAGALRLGPWGGASPGAEVQLGQEARVVDEIVAASLPESVGSLISGQAAEEALLEAVVGSET
jgi:hypothetical protein